ncbi:MAG: hypothetical protein P1U63_05175 [Coxiellaceae bacterium]|nr:hypothetical protein [Coxiellaceae bacterium]
MRDRDEIAFAIRSLDYNVLENATTAGNRYKTTDNKNRVGEDIITLSDDRKLEIKQLLLLAYYMHRDQDPSIEGNARQKTIRMIQLLRIKGLEMSAADLELEHAPAFNSSEDSTTSLKNLLSRPPHLDIDTTLNEPTLATEVSKLKSARSSQHKSDYAKVLLNTLRREYQVIRKYLNTEPIARQQLMRLAEQCEGINRSLTDILRAPAGAGDDSELDAYTIPEHFIDQAGLYAPPPSGCTPFAMFGKTKPTKDLFLAYTNISSGLAHIETFCCRIYSRLNERDQEQIQHEMKVLAGDISKLKAPKSKDQERADVLALVQRQLAATAAPPSTAGQGGASAMSTEAEALARSRRLSVLLTNSGYKTADTRRTPKGQARAERVNLARHPSSSSGSSTDSSSDGAPTPAAAPPPKPPTPK